MYTRTQQCTKETHLPTSDYATPSEAAVFGAQLTAVVSMASSVLLHLLGDKYFLLGHH